MTQPEPRDLRPSQDRRKAQTVERTCAVLDYLAGTAGPRILSDIATGTGLNRTVVRRILDTLVDFGYIERRSQGYQVGARMLVLGKAHLEQSGLVRQALPYLLSLRESLLADAPRTLMMSVPVGTDIIIVERIFGRVTPIEVIADVGSRYPLVETAMGRAILAQMPAQWLAENLAASDRELLSSRLGLIRSQGGVEFSTDPFPPMRSGIDSIALPVFDDAHRPMACLCLIGTDLQDHLVLNSPVTRLLLRASDSLTTLFGGHPARASALADTTTPPAV